MSSRQIGVQNFYFNIKEDKPELLIHKIFLSENNAVTTNNRYKEQLWQALQCPDITVIDNKKLDYKKKDLTQYFIKYNKCQNSPYQNLDSYRDKGLFSLNLHVGVNQTETIVNQLQHKRLMRYKI